MTISGLKSEAEQRGYLTEWEQDCYLHDCYIVSKFNGSFTQWLDQLDN